MAISTCQEETISKVPIKPSFTIDPSLVLTDQLILGNFYDLNQPYSTFSEGKVAQSDAQTLDQLKALAKLAKEQTQPTVLTSWENTDFPVWVRNYILAPYTHWATGVVRHRSDVVFLTYILFLSTIGIPNFVFLFVRFTWLRALFQWALVTYFVGAYSILMHNHIHGRGLLSKRWALVDSIFPYMLGPMMGQTWNSFYYHHKHHHVEENGPDDLSSTLRYQRDSLVDLSLYLGRFVLFSWLELPLYYIRKHNPGFAFRFLAWELMSYGFIILMSIVNFRAAMTGLVIPLIQWRIAVMMNNWGQHVFIDEDEPTSNLRCSITLIDVVANRHGFNDGYHTTHHLRPSQHWTEHPYAFMKSKQKLCEGRALIFHSVDFIKLAYLLLRKDYDYLAKCVIPIGDQVGMTNDELAAMLRRKTRRFSKEAIRMKYA